MYLPPAGISSKIASLLSPENIAREENAFPHMLVARTTKALVGGWSVISLATNKTSVLPSLERDVLQHLKYSF